VVKTLMSNQSKLQQQYSELKTQVSGSQKCSSVETSPRVGIVDGQHLHEKKDDNQESISHSNKRHGVELEEIENVRMQSLQKIKKETAQHTFLRNTKDKTPSQSLPEPSKKPRKFQAPLTKDDTKDIKCGMEIGLTSPNSKKLVALGTVQKTDRKAKANDGQPLADYIEVLVSIVYKQTTILPRSHGKIQNLGSATARCIPWPRQNIICRDGTPLQSKQVCSPISKITPNTRGTVGPKRSTSKADATRLDKGQVASQGLLEKKQAKRNVSKEETEQLTSSKYVEGHKSNIHITTSRC